MRYHVMRFHVVVYHNGQVYKSESEEYSPEDLKKLYELLAKINQLDYLTLDNDAGGKDFFPKDVLRQAVIRVVRLD